MGKDNEIEEQLITLVQPYPILYDLKNHQYKNSKMKESVWIKIGLAVNRKASECESMWKCLKSQYLAYKRKLDRPTGSGQSRPPYFRHAILMQFLRDSADSEQTFTTGSNSAESEHNDVVDDSESELLTSINYSENMNSTTTEDSTQIGNSFRKHIKFNGKRKLQPFEHELLDILKETLSAKEDEFDHFAKYMASQIRKIDSKNQDLALDIKLQFQQILTTAMKSVNSNTA